MSVLEPCLPHIGLLLANEHEAAAISGFSDVRSAARVFLDRGVATVVIKRGSKGCAVFSVNGPEIWALGLAVEPVDTTGAGDCFSGGFLAALYRGESLEEAARVANACGALSASRVGSISGVRNYPETLDWAAGTSTKGT